MLIEINVYIWQMRYFINFDKSSIALCIFFISYNWYTKYGMQLRNFEYFVLNDTIDIWLHNCENLKINDYYSTVSTIRQHKCTIWNAIKSENKIVNWFESNVRYMYMEGFIVLEKIMKIDLWTDQNSSEILMPCVMFFA